MGQEQPSAAIERLNRQYTQAYNSGQLDKVLDFFVDDAVILSPDQAPVRAREVLCRYFQEGFQRESKRDLALTSIRADTSGDLLYDAGQWRNSMTTSDGKSQSLAGYYLAVYRKMNGKWKIVTNIFSLLQPVVPPPSQEKKD